jgi:hypothetical protein
MWLLVIRRSGYFAVDMREPLQRVLRTPGARIINRYISTLLEEKHHTPCPRLIVWSTPTPQTLEFMALKGLEKAALVLGYH